MTTPRHTSTSSTVVSITSYVESGAWNTSADAKERKFEIHRNVILFALSLILLVGLAIFASIEVASISAAVISGAHDGVDHVGEWLS